MHEIHAVITHEMGKMCNLNTAAAQMFYKTDTMGKIQLSLWEIMDNQEFNLCWCLNFIVCFFLLWEILIIINSNYSIKKKVWNNPHWTGSSHIYLAESFSVFTGEWCYLHRCYGGVLHGPSLTSVLSSYPFFRPNYQEIRCVFRLLCWWQPTVTYFGDIP